MSAVADDVMLREPYEETLGDGYWLQAADGSYRDRPMQDDDTILFDQRLAINGLKYQVS